MNAGPATAGRRVDRYAILTFGLASFWLFGIGSLLALLVGRRSLGRLRADQELRGRTAVWSGIAVAILGLLLTALWIGVSLTA